MEESVRQFFLSLGAVMDSGGLFIGTRQYDYAEVARTIERHCSSLANERGRAVAFKDLPDPCAQVGILLDWPPIKWWGPMTTRGVHFLVFAPPPFTEGGQQYHWHLKIHSEAFRAWAELMVDRLQGRFRVRICLMEDPEPKRERYPLEDVWESLGQSVRPLGTPFRHLRRVL